MKLKDTELEKAIFYQVENVDSEITFEKIENLSLSNKSFSGKKLNMNLEELELFYNIKRLCLQYFKIDDKIIKIINGLTKLESLQLVSSEINCKEEILKNNNIKSLEINSCSVNDYSKICATENFYIISEKNFRLDKLKNKEIIKKIFLQNSKIKGFKSINECKLLKILNLDGSKVDNKFVLEKVDKNIEISMKNNYLPTA